MILDVKKNSSYSNVSYTQARQDGSSLASYFIMSSKNSLTDTQVNFYEIEHKRISTSAEFSLEE